MISHELEVILHMVFTEARCQRHALITVEHLLLGLLQAESAREGLLACAVDIEGLRKSLADHIKESTPLVSGDDEADTQPTSGFQCVIQRAISDVQSLYGGAREVFGVNALLSVFCETNSEAVRQLHIRGISRLDIANFISRDTTKDGSQTAISCVVFISHRWTRKEIEGLVETVPPDMRTRIEAFFQQGQRNARGSHVR